MESIIAFICICGLCIFVYAYIKMRQINKDYPYSCNILYIPEHDNSDNSSSYMDVLDHAEDDSKFEHTRSDTAPMGRSDIEDLIPSLNRRYDSVEIRELGR